MTKDAELVDWYFEHWRTKSDEMFWAWDEVTEVVTGNPARGVLLVLRLIEKAPDEEALAYVAAGPLEDLLCEHGAVVVDRLESEARSNARLVRALGGVWGENRMEPHVWSRIRQLARVS